MTRWEGRTDAKEDRYRVGELIVVPGPPPPIVDGDPDKKLTRASLLCSVHI